MFTDWAEISRHLGSTAATFSTVFTNLQWWWSRSHSPLRNKPQAFSFINYRRIQSVLASLCAHVYVVVLIVSINSVPKEYFHACFFLLWSPCVFLKYHQTSFLCVQNRPWNDSMYSPLESQTTSKQMEENLEQLCATWGKPCQVKKWKSLLNKPLFR